MESGLFKSFAITERHRVQFRAEAFNWLNHPNWAEPMEAANFGIPPAAQGQPDGNPTRGTFGKVTTKDKPPTVALELEVYVLTCAHYNKM